MKHTHTPEMPITDFENGRQDFADKIEGRIYLRLNFLIKNRDSPSIVVPSEVREKEISMYESFLDIVISERNRNEINPRMAYIIG